MSDEASEVAAVDVTWVPADLYERLASDTPGGDAPGLRRALAEATVPVTDARARSGYFQTMTDPYRRAEPTP